MSATSSAVTALDARTASRGDGTLTRLPVRRWVREADSRSLALPAVRHSSMTRAGLLALARVNAAVTGSRPEVVR